jgi:hypothetical protein
MHLGCLNSRHLLPKGRALLEIKLLVFLSPTLNEVVGWTTARSDWLLELFFWGILLFIVFRVGVAMIFAI